MDTSEIGIASLAASFIYGSPKFSLLPGATIKCSLLEIPLTTFQIFGASTTEITKSSLFGFHAKKTPGSGKPKGQNLSEMTTTFGPQSIGIESIKLKTPHFLCRFAGAF